MILGLLEARLLPSLVHRVFRIRRHELPILTDRDIRGPQVERPADVNFMLRPFGRQKFLLPANELEPTVDLLLRSTPSELTRRNWRKLHADRVGQRRHLR